MSNDTDTETDDTPPEGFGYSPETPSENFWPGEWVSREALEPNDWNPNEMGEEARDRLLTSLMDNGWTQPIVVHAEDDYIIDGEQRWHVASEEPFCDRDDVTPEGVPAGHVPVFGITVDEGHARISTVQHNRSRGYVDANKLKGYLSQLQERNALEDVHDRIGVDTEDAQLLLDDVTAAGQIGEGETLGAPWEPVDRTELSEDEMEEERSQRVKQAIERSNDDTLSEEEREKAKEVATSTARCNFVMDTDEMEIVEEALGDERPAESFMNLIRYFLDNEMVDRVRDDVDYDAENPYDPESA